jgi:hypothetical protein
LRENQLFYAEIERLLFSYIIQIDEQKRQGRKPLLSVDYVLLVVLLIYDD